MKWKKTEAVQTTQSGTNFKKKKLTYLNSYMHFSGCLFQFVTYQKLKLYCGIFSYGKKDKTQETQE